MRTNENAIKMPKKKKKKKKVQTFSVEMIGVF